MAKVISMFMTIGIMVWAEVQDVYSVWRARVRGKSEVRPDEQKNKQPFPGPRCWSDRPSYVALAA